MQASAPDKLLPLKQLQDCQQRVLVLGDTMLDRYWQGPTQRISPEAPVPVVRINDQSLAPGGAGNVAVNIASLGIGVDLLAWVGEDENADLLQDLLQTHQVDCHFERLSQRPTTTKLRVLSQHQQLIRIDFEDTQKPVDTQNLLALFKQQLAFADVVILSDYGKGLLNDPQPFIQAARAAHKALLIDPKKNDFSAYRGATLITPNMKEFEAVVGPCADEAEIEAKARQQIAAHDLQALLVTRGEKGMSLIERDKQAQQFPTHAREVYDVTGAGDTVIATLAAGFASGLPLAQSVQLSCAAAGVVVGRVGTASVSLSDLYRESGHHNQLFNKIIALDRFLPLRQQWRQTGQRMVITNGCFDLLHPGHVSYLNQAAELGDILVVAVNSDDSVRRLKGASRPVNSLDDRLQMLAALQSVDYVLSFEEDTPAELYRQIQPDVLVKGGDYQIHEIAGHEYADEVLIMELVPGKSSSAIIRKIEEKP